MQHVNSAQWHQILLLWHVISIFWRVVSMTDEKIADNVSILNHQDEQSMKSKKIFPALVAAFMAHSV